MRTVKTIAYFLSAALLAGCERDAAEEGRPVAGERPLLFTARIAGGDADGVSVGTRDGDINKPLDGADSARNALLKKTFTIGKTASECDAIRICNVGSSTEQPTFGLSNPHCFQYICSKHNTTYVDDGTQPENPFPDTGSTEEDNYVNGHNQTWSEYLFMPDSTDGTKRGFYISNLISDGNNYFRFYALWCRGQEEESLPKIRTDQHKEEDFLNSDAMLAGMQHNINNFDKPIRLIFSHIHAMLDVRIALPTYDAGYKRGEWDETEERLPSGYRPADVRLCMTTSRPTTRSMRRQ